MYLLPEIYEDLTVEPMGNMRLQEMKILGMQTGVQHWGWSKPKIEDKTDYSHSLISRDYQFYQKDNKNIKGAPKKLDTAPTVEDFDLSSKLLTTLYGPKRRVSSLQILPGDFKKILTTEIKIPNFVNGQVTHDRNGNIEFKKVVLAEMLKGPEKQYQLLRSIPG